MKKLLGPIGLAAVLWFLMFSPWTGDYFNFWFFMSFSALVLSFLSLIYGRGLDRTFSINARDFALGIGSAALLWGVFYLGDICSTLIFPFADGQITSIYDMKSGQNPALLVGLLLFIIGPAEEIFWRGYVQNVLMAGRPPLVALALSSILYALVHIWSFNFILVMAALVCGVFWGLLYKVNNNMFTLVVSHGVWDVAVFILFPI